MTELVSRKIRRYGWSPSLPLFGEPTANIDELKILAEVDPRSDLAKLILNQWALGSCTSNATENAFRYDAILDGNDPGLLSRFQIYWGERKLEGSLGQGDTGAYGHDAFTVARHGLAPDSAWPYKWPGMEEDQPPEGSVFDPAKLPEAVVEQSSHYVLKKRVARVSQTQQAIQAVLSNKQTIAYGFTVYESFESSEVAKGGIVPMPQQGERVLGGHEVWAVGYLKSEPHYCLCANSWGSRQTDGNAWGLDGSGFFLMPWSYLCNPQLASDLRTIVRAK